MERKSCTVLARLVARREDSMGYVTYVFECLDDDVREKMRYVMCTRFPNWNHRDIGLFEEGYLNFSETAAGVSEWFDGKDFHAYNYDGVQFNKFVRRVEDDNKDFIM